MNMTMEEKNVVIEHRLKTAGETLVEAKDLIRLNHWRGAANRLYYACFYAANALLLKHGHVARTHGGVTGLLGKHFVTTGIIGNEHNKLYKKLYDLRQGGDYNDWAEIGEENVKPLLELAENFIAEIEKLLKICDCPQRPNMV